MVCTHLKQLYDLCETHQLKMAGSDMIRIVCKTCNEHEICPSMRMHEYTTEFPKLHQAREGGCVNAQPS